MVGCRPLGGFQALKRTPATASPEAPVGVSGRRAAVAGDDVAARDRSPSACTCSRSTEESTKRTVPPAGAFLAHHVPGLQRLAQLQRHAAVLGPRRGPGSGTRAGPRTSPDRRRSRRRSRSPSTSRKSLPDEMRQHEAVVQRRAPAHQPALLRLAPEPGDQRAEQQLLGQAHARVRRHLEGAELDQAEPAGRAVRRIELVDADLGAVGVAGRHRPAGCGTAGRPARAAAARPRRRRHLAPARSPARRARRAAPRRPAAPGWSGR